MSLYPPNSSKKRSFFLLPQRGFLLMMLQQYLQCQQPASSSAVSGTVHALDARSQKRFLFGGEVAILNIIVLGINPANVDRFKRQGCPRFEQPGSMALLSSRPGAGS